MKTSSFFLATEPVSYGPDTRSPAACVPEIIRARAYQIYERRGREPGHDLDDWLQAERETNIHLGIIKQEITGEKKHHRDKEVVLGAS